MKKINYIFIFILLGFTACVDEIPVKSWPVDPILVANSLITPDSVFRCDVFRISSLPDENVYPITNATVTIYDNESNALISHLSHWKNGQYRSNTKPQTGKTYRLEVTAKGYTPLEATTTVPGKVSVDSVYVFENKDKEIVEGWGDYYSELNFILNDTDMAANYYDVFLSDLDTISYYYRNEQDSLIFTDSLVLGTNFNNIPFFASGFKNTDAVLTHENLMQYNPSSILFSDELFNQSVHHFVIRFLYNGGNYSFLSFVSGSKEYYEYRKFWFIHLYNQADKQFGDQIDAMKMDFSTHPIEMYSNIKGGYGIFAAYNTTLLFKECFSEQDTIYNDFPSYGYQLRGKIHYNRTTPCDKY